MGIEEDSTLSPLATAAAHHALEILSHKAEDGTKVAAATRQPPQCRGCPPHNLRQLAGPESLAAHQGAPVPSVAAALGGTERGDGVAQVGKHA